MQIFFHFHHHLIPNQSFLPKLRSAKLGVRKPQSSHITQKVSAMTPDNNAELHLRTVSEMAIMRILLTSLCRQSPDAKALLSDFLQRVEEQRALGVIHSGQVDERFERFADLYAESIAFAGNIQQP